MESISSANLPLVWHTLEQLEQAINRVHFEVINKDLNPLKEAISFFKKELLDE